MAGDACVPTRFMEQSLNNANPLLSNAAPVCVLSNETEEE